ncbi:MAG: hypothetical protein H6532_03030 [Thermoleophilales bacterium]|nr:hypothetical protein [Thermoleophilales bacterium]
MTTTPSFVPERAIAEATDVAIIVWDCLRRGAPASGGGGGDAGRPATMIVMNKWDITEADIDDTCVGVPAG